MDDELPLSSLESSHTRKKKKSKGKPRRSRTRSPARIPSPLGSKKNNKRAVLRVSALSGEQVGIVKNIKDFASEQDEPMKIAFAISGTSSLILIKTQQEMDALPPGVYDAQMILTAPTKGELEAFARKRKTNAISKPARLK